jgi:hypothetical protein
MFLLVYIIVIYVVVNYLGALIGIDRLWDNFLFYLRILFHYNSLRFLLSMTCILGRR